jgi:hypothetical protein
MAARVKVLGARVERKKFPGWRSEPAATTAGFTIDGMKDPLDYYEALEPAGLGDRLKPLVGWGRPCACRQIRERSARKAAPSKSRKSS